jgi:type II secretory pathway component GspD/PulD (secretin)
MISVLEILNNYWIGKTLKVSLFTNPDGSVTNVYYLNDNGTELKVTNVIEDDDWMLSFSIEFENTDIKLPIY